eukprot:scaffold26122_cov127-Cylindrotheca_fusiformis.AAC.4
MPDCNDKCWRAKEVLTLILVSTCWIITLGANYYNLVDADHDTKKEVFAFAGFLLVLIILEATVGTRAERLEPCLAISNAVREVKAIKTVWGATSFAIFNTLLLLILFSELCEIASPVTPTALREQALWTCGFFYLAINSGTRLWNLIIVATFSFTSYLITTRGTSSKVDFLMAPRNGFLLCALLCSVLDAWRSGGDSKSKVDHFPHCRQVVFSSICLPLLWIARGKVPEVGIALILSFLCSVLFVKSAFDARFILTGRGQIAICIIYVAFILAVNFFTNWTFEIIEGVFLGCRFICFFFSTNNKADRWRNVAIFSFHGFLWVEIFLQLLPYIDGDLGTRRLWAVGFFLLADAKGIEIMNVAVVWGVVVVTNVYNNSNGSLAEILLEPTIWRITIAFFCALVHACQSKHNAGQKQHGTEDTDDDDDIVIRQSYDYEKLDV